MKVLIVGHDEVSRLLPMNACIAVMADAFRILGEGGAVLPLRQILFLPESRDALGMMPAAAGGAVGAKVITVFPGNQNTPYDAHQGAILLFETEYGRLQAIIDATSVTAIRTAATSALATRLLARPDAGDLALIGSGVQAAVHLEAMAAVRPIRRVRVYSRNREHAAAFARQAAVRHGLPVAVADTAREAVAGAEIVCTLTSSLEPVLQGDWLAPGAHVNAVGFTGPQGRELDDAAVAKSHLFVDRRQSALSEAGEIRHAIAGGAISEAHIRGELGDLVVGRVAGRTDPAEITLFRSLGVAVQDLAAAQHIYRQAVALGQGAWVEFSGERAASS